MNWSIVSLLISILCAYRCGDCQNVTRTEDNDSKNEKLPVFEDESLSPANKSERWPLTKLSALRDILVLMQQDMNATLASGEKTDANSSAPETSSRISRMDVPDLDPKPAMSSDDEKNEEIKRVMNTDIPKLPGRKRASELKSTEEEPEVDEKENRKIDRNVDNIILVPSNSDLKENSTSATKEENAENARMLAELKAKLTEIGNEGDKDMDDPDTTGDRDITFDDIVGRAEDVDDPEDADDIHYGDNPALMDNNDESEVGEDEDYEMGHRSSKSSGPVAEKLVASRDLSLGMMDGSESQNVVMSAPYVSAFSGSAFRPNSSHSLDTILDLYNPARLADKWRLRDSSLKLTPTCESDVEFFLTALKNRMPWAVKMIDASGKYSSSFFWGNQYWMGSKTLCSQISAPFPLGFSVVRGHLTLLGIDSQTRAILIGVCLPHSCTKDDIAVVFDWSIRMGPAASEREFQIKQVRSPQQYYNMFHDSTFWLLVIITSIVVLLLVSATILDYYLDSHWSDGSVWKQKSYTFDNYSYEIAKGPQHTNILKDEMCQNIKIDSNDAHLKNDGKANTPIENHLVLVDNGRFRIPEIVTDIILSFSVRRNMAQICNNSVDIDTLPTVHGLRALNMAWVILGHTCIIAFKYSDNMEYKKLIEKEFLFQTINNAAFAVDSFFFISGLLVSFLYFRTTARMDVTKLTKTTGFKSNCLEFVGLLVYRFGRLTTPYFFMIGVVEVCMKWFHYNSVFEAPADDHINCPNYWWRNILYINTLFPVKDMCMIWSWYLADDTQFYIVGCIILIMAVKHFRVAAVVMTFFLVTSWFVTGFIAYTNKHIPNVDDPLALFDKIYDKPWTRLGPYLIGMSVGWILFKTDCSIKFSKKVSVAGWTASILGLVGLVVGLYKQDLHPITAAAFSALSHSLWALCLAWIVIACSIGNGGIMNKFLSSPLFYPYSRVTYCAYLVHPIVMRSMVMTRDSPVHLSILTIAVYFVGQLVVSYIISFSVSLAFEAPVVSLLRLVAPKKEKKKA